MKLSSKSILSPARTDKFHEPTLSFSSSLSRRLRSNGSIKGGQSSPMFTTGSKKRGYGFDNPEPSSPKVTCIGQVRVKTKKKQGKKMRTRSRRYGEVTFKKTEQTQEGFQQKQCFPHRNQKWVHLPLTICETLRAFGAEFNCFLPCGGRSSCSSMNEKEKVEKRTTVATTTTSTTSSCGAIFARWLMDLQDGEDEKRRDMDFLVEEEKIVKGFGEFEIKEKKEVREVIEERLSVCVPPKNALLLMRCRSEPLRMSALVNRFWDSPNIREEGEEEYFDEEDEESEEEEKLDSETVEEIAEISAKAEAFEDQESSQEEENPLKPKEEEEEEIALNGSSLENPIIEKEGERKSKLQERLVEKEESRVSFSPYSEMFVQLEEERLEKSTEEMETQERSAATVREKEDRVYEEDKQKSKERESAMLPDCLLLMMCEPKLSMEVSKETWVCSTDFIKCRPNKKVVIMDGGDDCKNRNSTDSYPAQLLQQQQEEQQIQEVGPSMATMIQEKLVNAVAYEPFVLTRCKSEPLRSSAKLVSEPCSWKNMQMETHRHGVSAAGVGF